MKEESRHVEIPIDSCEMRRLFDMFKVFSVLFFSTLCLRAQTSFKDAITELSSPLKKRDLNGCVLSQAECGGVSIFHSD